MVDRIKAAVDARSDASFVIMARTDAFATEGMASAIDRACACVEAGADMIFRKRMTELNHYQQFVQAVKVPVLRISLSFGLTPLFTRDELHSVGVSMILYPLSAFRAMNAAALNVYEHIKKEGTQKSASCLPCKHAIDCIIFELP